MKTIFTIMRKTRLKFRTFMLFYLIASVVVAVAMVFTNRFEGYLAESALYSDMAAMRNFLLLITGLVIIRAFFTGLRTLFRLRHVAKAEYNLRNYFIDHFLRIPFGKVEAAGSGEILSVYSNDIENTAVLVVSNIAVAIEGLATFVSAVVFLHMMSTQMGGIMNVGFLVLLFLGMVGIVVLLTQPMNYFMKKASEETAKFNAVVNDSLQNLSVVVAYSLEEVVEDRYMSVYGRYMKAIKKVAFASIAMIVVTFLALFGPLAAVNVLLAFRVIDGALTIPGFIAYNATLMMAVGGLSTVANGIGSMAGNIARAKRVIENTGSQPEEIGDGEVVDTRVPLDITFNNVHFSYKTTDLDAEEKIADNKTAKTKKKGGLRISFGAKSVVDVPDIDQTEEEIPTQGFALEDVSFNIKAGSKVAFVGGSGSGKSTILKLLLGLYEPEQGQITIGGKDAMTLSKGSLREISAYVPQDSFLFPESIGENITLQQEVTDLTRLEKACEQAGILDFVNSLPDGFDSVLAESSENISGGQRQRIAMARALYKDAPVILFDEATSALDPATESAIIDSLTKAAADKTVIMVTHRTKPIAMCDTIIVMDAGKIVDIGTHEELLKTNETYRNLEVRQND